MGANVPTVRINRKRFDHELAIRGLDGRSFAKLVGCHEMTVSRARNGDPIEVSIVNRMAEILTAIPPGLHPLAGRLIAMPGETTNAATDQAAASKEAGDGTAVAPV